MTLLAYVDVRPFLFVVGLPLFVALCLLVCWWAGARFKKSNVVLISSLVFSGIFLFALTGLGPFVDRKEIREHWMAWEIRPTPSQGMKEPEVVLSFVDFPGHFLGEYSAELANHLIDHGEQPVKVIFAVTSDYGRVRGFRVVEIAGLREWKSQWGYAGVTDSPQGSPWD